ncbi:MAG: class I SAM-dependent RNA methyltransferase [Spirochaetales bacterium]|nr:class I SAM-dependent RNA methyltransferase [Spirochaetales bacterium]MBP7264387.1 class I SAM-dependent RNA methyltransferase [Spirochaetia bacterium]
MLDTENVSTVSIERLAPGGDGLGFVDGMAVFVPFTAPGDTVRARLRDRKPGWARADLLEIIHASAERTAPACPLYGQCGGCDLMHMAYDAQLRAKASIVADALARVGKLDGVNVAARGSREFGYRNRARFHRTQGGSPGFKRRQSDDVLELPTCPVLVNELAVWLEDGPGRKPGPPPGSLAFTAFGAGGRVWLEGGGEDARARVLGRDFVFDPAGFFQSNVGALESLAAELRRDLSGERAADLYCGVGLFASFLKDSFARVTCVERDARSVSYAAKNLGPGTDLAAMDLDAWTRTSQAAARYDCVVLDPPRGGLSKTVRAWLARSAPPRVAYVSCDPVSFARDAGELCRNGYELSSVGVFDFYPQTSHIETLGRFERA